MMPRVTGRQVKREDVNRDKAGDAGLSSCLLFAVLFIACTARGQTTRPTTRPMGPDTRPSQSATSQTQPATQPAHPEIASSLKALSSPDWHERRKAQDELVAGGEEAKPFIAELVRAAPDAESRKNAEAALARIDQNRAQGPSLITLHVKDATPRQVFAELSRQCFAPLPTWPDNLWEQGSWPKVTLDVDHKPFWKVVPQVCQQLGVDFRPFQNGMRIMHTGGAQAQGVAEVDGPFLVVANQISYSRTRNFGGGGEQTQFGMNLSVYAEPKLTVLRGSGAVHLDEVVDDHGNSLVPQANAPRMFWGGSVGFGGWSLYAPLQYPKKDPGARIARFKGTTSFVLQTKMEKLDIPDVMNLKQTTRLVTDTSITFQSMKKNGDNYDLHLIANQANLGGPEWQQLVEMLQTRLQILDSDGNPLDHRGMNSSGNNNSIELTLDFARGNTPDGRQIGQPSRLLWEIPTETRQVTVSIDFRDLPLFSDK